METSITAAIATAKAENRFVSDRELYHFRSIAPNKKTSLCRCVGTHQRYVGQTDNFNHAVSRLLIMSNRPHMILQAE